MSEDQPQPNQELSVSADSLPTQNETPETTLEQSEVTPELAQVLETLNPEQRASVTRVVKAAIKKESFRGPIPHPEILQRYEAILPGSAERILQMAEKEQAHRFELDDGQLECSKIVINNTAADSKRGQWFALIISVLFLAGSVFLAYYGHETIAGILGGGTLLGIVTAFIAGKKNKNDKETD